MLHVSRIRVKQAGLNSQKKPVVSLMQMLYDYSVCTLHLSLCAEWNQIGWCCLGK